MSTYDVENTSFRGRIICALVAQLECATTLILESYFANLRVRETSVGSDHVCASLPEKPITGQPLECTAFSYPEISFL